MSSRWERLATGGISGRSHALLRPEIPPRCARRDDGFHPRHSHLRHWSLIRHSDFVIRISTFPLPRVDSQRVQERHQVRQEQEPALVRLDSGLALEPVF